MFDLAIPTMKDIKDVSEITANFATTVGLIAIPFVIISYFSELKRQRNEAKMTTYLSLSDDYANWLKLCFDNLDLEIPNMVEIGRRGRNLDQKTMQDLSFKKEQLAFVILTCMFEKAYFLYKDHQDDKFKSAQYDGWIAYIKDYCERPKYIEHWRSGGGEQFDRGFIDFMEKNCPQLRAGTAGESAPAPLTDPPQAADIQQNPSSSMLGPMTR